MKTPLKKNFLIIFIYFVMVPIYSFAAPSLRKEGVVIISDIITAADVFSGLTPEIGARYLAPAPEPGESMTLPASDLLRIAKAFDIPWQSITGQERVVLTRTGVVIDAKAIESALLVALRTKGLTGDVMLTYFGGPPRFVLLQHNDSIPHLRVTSADFDPSTGFFSGDIEVGNKTHTIKGEIQILMHVPVLAESMQAGTHIGPQDITFLRLPTKTVQKDTLLDSAAISGMVARRALSAGTPLRAGDVAQPRLVTRGENVTITLRDGPMELTALGRALENGGKGDVVRVTNAASGHSIEARVTGDRHVVVEGL